MSQLSRQEMLQLVQDVDANRILCMKGNSEILGQMFVKLLSSYQTAIRSQYPRYTDCHCDCDRYDVSYSDTQKRYLKLGNLVYRTSKQYGNRNTFLINLLNCRGNSIDLQFSQTIKISDGILILLQLNNNTLQLKSILTQVINQIVKPVFFIDIGKLEATQNDILDIFKSIEKLMLEVRSEMSQIADRRVDKLSVEAFKIQTCLIGSLDEGWAFSLSQFVDKIYSKCKQKKFPLFTFNNSYYDDQQGSWKDKSIMQQKEELVPKNIISQIIEFLICLRNSALQKKYEQFENKLSLSEEQINKEKDLCNEGKRFMSKWLSRVFKLQQSILDVVVTQVPSPRVNNDVKVRRIFEGSQDSKIFQSIRDCNTKGPLIIYTAGQQQLQRARKLFKIGRVYSGTCEIGQKQKVYQIDGKKQHKKCFQKAINFFYLCGLQANRIQNQIQAGNLVLLPDLNTSSKSCCIITDFKIDQNDKFIATTYGQNNCLKISIQPKSPGELPKFISLMKRIQRKNHNIQFQTSDTGEHLIYGSCKSQIQQCLSQLSNNYMQIIRSDITPLYKETLTEKSSQLVMVKSQNKHNRLYGMAQPLNSAVMSALIDLNYNQICVQLKRKERLKVQCGWDELKHGNIWSFGEYCKENILVNNTKSETTPVNQIRDSVCSAFNWTTKEGVLCEQKCSGIEYHLIDYELISDAIHRGGGQIIPTARRMFYASTLLGKPAILQPFTRTLIEADKKLIGQIVKNHSDLTIVQQKVINENKQNVQYQYVLEIPSLHWDYGFFSLANSVSVVETIWKKVDGNPLELGTRANEIVALVRAQKGLNINLPDINNYIDKL